MRTTAFKQYARGQRGVTVEETFSGGINYTNTPLGEGYYNMLVNYAFKDDGKILIPRAGYKSVPESRTEITTAPTPYACLQTGTAYAVDVQETADTRASEELHKFLIFGQTAAQQATVPTYTTENIVLALDTNTFSETPSFTTVPAVFGAAFPCTFKTKNYTNQAYMHEMRITQSETRFITSALNGKQYYLTDAGLVSLMFQTYENGTEGVFEVVDPYTATPTEAVNYGYNMLSGTPYSFKDTASEAYVTGTIGMQGILPYTDSSTKQLLFNAKVGTPVTFRLFVDFPKSQAAKYMFKWEVRDLNSDAITVYEDCSRIYTTDPVKEVITSKDAAGNSVEGITLTFQPPYRQFSITVTAYGYAEDGSIDSTEPIGVLPFAAYNLVGDSISAMNQIDVKTYDITTGTGMCAWAQRLVVWGVEAAEHILFVSDVNNPAYFPYPNNAEVFDAPIIACVPFMNKLLVFTESTLYLLTWADDGLSYVSEVVQESLAMTAQDAETITVVKNMVYFKNGNYFYMIVPSTNNVGELVLAPISKPITNLLDNFETEVLTLFKDMYNPDRFKFLTAGSKYRLVLNDFINFLDGNCIRNVYSFTLSSTSEDAPTFLTFAFVLNYNSVLRTWTTDIMETNNTLLKPYKQTVTDQTLFINTINQPQDYISGEQEGGAESEGTVVHGFAVTFELVRPDPLNCSDAFILTTNERKLKNWQYIDTGYREHDSATKKRYRELQFKINNVEQTSMEYGMCFLIDDDLRRSFYKYVPEVYTNERYIEDDTGMPVNNPNFGWVYMRPEYAEPAFVSGATFLEDTPPSDIPYPEVQLSTGEILDTNRWALDTSKLAQAVTYKVRVPVSGKGYAPRLKLLSFNEKRYELLTLNWVYRTMNSR